MQDDYVQPFLSVQESMMFAANLKLGSHESKENKKKMVWFFLVRWIAQQIFLYSIKKDFKIEWFCTGFEGFRYIGWAIFDGFEWELHSRA